MRSAEPWQPRERGRAEPARGYASEEENTSQRKKEGDIANQDSVSGCSIRVAQRHMESLSNLRSLPFGPTRVSHPWMRWLEPRHGLSQSARSFGWSGPDGEEFAPDNISVCHDQAELLTETVNGTSRRNVLGAILSFGGNSDGVTG